MARAAEDPQSAAPPSHQQLGDGDPGSYRTVTLSALALTDPPTPPYGS